MSDQIIVTFEFQGKEYRGTLDKVMGAGNTATFHLSVPDEENPKAVWYWGTA